MRMEDDYTFVQINHVESDNNGSTIDLLGNLDARTSPYGEADFMISAYVSSDVFNLKAAYPVSSIYKRHVSPDDFVRSHLTADVMEKVNLYFERKCPNKECPYNYALTSRPLSFNMKACKVSPVEPKDETFKLYYNENIYYFRTNFATGQTSITFNVPQPGRTYVFAPQEVVHMKAEKFIKYPLDPEFLLNKLKTLLLFS
jgi:hypothetical protein